MSDFQVLLLIGLPQIAKRDTRFQSDEHALNALLEPLLDDPMLTVFHSPSLADLLDSMPCEASETENPASFSTGNVSAFAEKRSDSPTSFLEKLLPDLICLFTTTKDKDAALDFCRTLRGKGEQGRPVLVVHSAAQEEERIQYLLEGADDILDAQLSPEEFKIRLLVHLRRRMDFSAHELTGLPGLPLTQKLAQRRLNRQEPVALITMAIDQLDVYQESYGDLPTAQLLKACAAMLHRVVLMPPDFISQTDENHFVILTQPEKAEKLAALLCRQFEAAAPNFYSEPDRKRGYMVSVISDQISRRVPLLSLSLGIATSQTHPLRTFASLFNTSQQLCALARMQPDSGWQSDRLRLSTSEALTQAPQQSLRPGILVVETDAALAYLLKTTLSMEGYSVDLVSDIEEAHSVIAEKMPLRRLQLVILDAVVHQEAAGLILTRELSQQYPQLQIICTSSLHNRSEVLQAGAHLYLPRPFELSSLFFWIHRLLPESWP